MARRLEDVLKTSWKCLEDEWTRRIYWSWPRPLEDVWLIRTYSPSSRRLEDVFWRRRRKTSSRRLHQDEWLLGNVLMVLIWIYVLTHIFIFLIYKLEVRNSQVTKPSCVTWSHTYWVTNSHIFTEVLLSSY